MRYVMGIDLGTSSLKIILVNKNGIVKYKVKSDYDIESSKTGYSEQDPEIWITALENCFSKINSIDKKILNDTIGLSVSGQMHTLVTLDSNLNVVRKAILWNDTRANNECEFLNKNFKTQLLKITKNIALQGFTLPKLLWLKENEKENYKKISKICMPKDYLIYRLTGILQTELSDAAGTLFLDIKERKWSKEICDSIDISIDILPKLNNSNTLVGNPIAIYNEKFNLNTNLKVFSGGADNAIAALGSSLIDESKSLISIGTSGVILTVNKELPIANGDCHIFSHSINELTYSMGVTLSAGYSLKWFKEIFLKDLDYDQIMEMVKKSDIGANGILFTPWFFGERTPHSDSNIKANFLGINSNCGIKDFARAVIEGITFSLKNVIKAINLNEKNLSLISVGGGSKSDYWLQLQSDILNSKIVCLKNNEGAATGAAIIAAVGCGWFNDYKSCCDKFVEFEKVFVPNKDSVEKYETIFNLYLKVYEMTKEFYKNHKLIFSNN